MEKEASVVTQEENIIDDIKEKQSTSCDDQPPPYEASVRRRNIESVSGTVLSTGDEDKILSLLREIVRKCTVANPMKRPTAREVLQLIEKSAPSSVLKQKFDLSDEEEEEDTE